MENGLRNLGGGGWAEGGEEEYEHFNSFFR